MRRVHVEQLAGNAIGSLEDNFVIVEWTAEVGGPLDCAAPPVHHEERRGVVRCCQGLLASASAMRKSKHRRTASAVLARRGTAHTFWNAGPGEARYLLVMTPRIAGLVEEIHRPGADVAAIFAAHKSLLVPGR